VKFLGFFMQLNPPIYYWTTLKGYKIPSKIIPKTTLKSDCIYFHMESSFAHRHTFSHIRGMRMENKRRGRRVKEENRLICEIVSDNKDLNCKKVFYTLTKDISLGGVNIQTDTFLPVDTVVKMELSLPKIHKIVCIRSLRNGA
jgi:hypothetical protein